MTLLFCSTLDVLPGFLADCGGGGGGVLAPFVSLPIKITAKL